MWNRLPKVKREVCEYNRVPKDECIQIKVQYLLDLLKTYSITSRSFRDVDEHYQGLAAVTQQLRVTDQEVRA
ncbi:MAG TPA: hypothetical protein VFG90_01030 [Nitrososphaeraceae archaeon]|nr:hypothetical protein [Nitrososphaeraceae archaeon]